MVLTDWPGLALASICTPLQRSSGPQAALSSAQPGLISAGPQDQEREGVQAQSAMLQALCLPSVINKELILAEHHKSVKDKRNQESKHSLFRDGFIFCHIAYVVPGLLLAV